MPRVLRAIEAPTRNVFALGDIAEEMHACESESEGRSGKGLWETKMYTINMTERSFLGVLKCALRYDQIC